MKIIAIVFLLPGKLVSNRIKQLMQPEHVKGREVSMTTKAPDVS